MSLFWSCSSSILVALYRRESVCHCEKCHVFFFLSVLFIVLLVALYTPQDNLDVYEKYSENPGQLPFLTRIVRSLLREHRQVDFHVEPLYGPSAR